MTPKEFILSDEERRRKLAFMEACTFDPGDTFIVPCREEENDKIYWYWNNFTNREGEIYSILLFVIKDMAGRWKKYPLKFLLFSLSDKCIGSKFHHSLLKCEDDGEYINLFYTLLGKTIKCVERKQIQAWDPRSGSPAKYKLVFEILNPDDYTRPVALVTSNSNNLEEDKGKNKTWKCRNCDTVNPDTLDVCEVCDSHAPVLTDFEYELDLVYKVVKFYWKSKFCDKVTLSIDGNSYDVSGKSSFKLKLEILHFISIKHKFSIRFQFSNDVTNREYSTDIELPDVRKLKEIIESEKGFKDCQTLRRLVIPDSVTTIGRSAFNGCSSLVSILIPDSVTSIGNGAFSDCSNLTSIHIPDSVISIGHCAFSYCSSLTSITVSKNNPVFDSRGGSNAIIESSTNTLRCGCKNTIIPDTVKSIGSSAFYGCSSLTSIYIPDSVASIGDGAFFGCSSLTSIYIPDSVTIIGNGAFSGCSSLMSITVSKNNPVFDSRDGCNAIIESSTNTLRCGCKNTIIPNSVTTIGRSAFNGCSSLTSIHISDSVTNIGFYAFSGCLSLSSTHIPDSVTSIGDGAFFGCSSLTSIHISDSVTSIGFCAFSGCSSLTSIHIPDSVTSIGHGAFYNCSSLTSITANRKHWTHFEKYDGSAKIVYRD